MKIYVASVLADRPRVQAIQDTLKELGHEIVLDWTLRSDNKPYADHAGKVSAETIETIESLKDLDVLIVLASDQIGRGMYVELGASLMHYQQHGKPQIFAIGPFNENTAFYFHPAVTRINNIEEAMDCLKKNTVHETA